MASTRSSAWRLLPDRAPPVIRMMLMGMVLAQQRNGCEARIHPAWRATGGGTGGCRVLNAHDRSDAGLRPDTLFRLEEARRMSLIAFSAAAMALAMLIDAVIGWPAWLYARIGHPVTWIGAAITWCDRRLNREGDAPARRARAGMLAALAVILAASLPALFVALLLPDGIIGLVLTALLAWPLIATRSMHDHVTAVATPLSAGDLEGARAAVAMIVGRDPALLDTPGVTRDRKSTRLNSSHSGESRMPSSA